MFRLLRAGATALVVGCHVLALTPLESLSTSLYAPAVPNPTGSFALVNGVNFTFDESSGFIVGVTSFWNLLNLTTGDISTWYLGSEISEVVFVGPKCSSVLYINGSQSGVDGSVGLYTADATSLETSSTLVATLPAPFAGLKAAQTADGSIGFLVYSKANQDDGSPYNPVQAVDPVVYGGSSARIYDSSYVRVSDHWRTPQRNAVFGGTLKSRNGSYTFDGDLTNYVTGICDVTCAESPRDLGSADLNDYDLAPDGSLVAFDTKDIHLPLANYSSSQIYVVPFDSTAANAIPINARGGSAYTDAQGFSTSPKFSPDSSKLLYLQMNSIANGNAKSFMYIADVSSTPFSYSSNVGFNITRLASSWDRSPLQVGWSSDSELIYAGSPDRGSGVLFAIPVTADDSYEPVNITSGGTVLGAYTLPNNTLLVTDTKFWTPCDIYSVDFDGSGTIQTYFEANKEDPILSAAGLDSSIASEFYYTTNTSKIEQQAWVVYPEDFDPSKRYPLALISHGGPEAASFNMWGFEGQFNYKVWADQGYVVVAPNPTGSWGFGQNLTDAAYGHWGSYIFWDMINCWQHVKDNMPFVDVERGIHAGASFGGYMSNWIQGQDFGREFKALVTVSGLTLTQAQGATDQLDFPLNDFLGPVNSTAFKPGNPYYDFNPLMYVENWATPHYVVHSSLDYRLPESEGIMLFSLLQQNGVPSKLLNFPDEGHVVLENPANQVVWYKEIFDFINHYSGAGS